METQRPVVSRLRGLSVWACVIAAVALVAGIGSVIAILDVRRDVQTKRDSELTRLLSHAERSATHIATQLTEQADAAEIAGQRGDPTDLRAIRRTRWLRTYWTQSLARQPYRLYAAVVDLKGNVVAHTSRDREHRQVGEEALHNSHSLEGNRLAEVRDDVLTGGQRALDVQVPIRQGDQVVGVYHAGLDADWLEEVLDEERANRSQFWLRLISGMCGVLLLSSVAVVRVTRHTASLEHQIEAANARRISEMNELVLGLAHEIRNPLNAIRLNIHTVGQVFRDEAALTDREISLMLDEMETEIARLESLMREMLGFVRRGNSKAAPMEVAEEIQRTLTLMRGTLDEQRCEVRVDFSDEPCIVAMDRMRLRQVLFNLLNNALEAQGPGGSIDILATAARGQVEILVSDDGPGIAAADQERVFVPFFSTKASGTGLGLALARKFIEEAGGAIHCEGNQRRRGTSFRIVLPASSEEVVEVVT